ncbi:15419_t:CDS:2, partial [Entrophospora sp. SA101]
MSNRKPKTRCFSMDNKYNDISTPTTADMIKNGSLLALSAGNAFSNYAPVVGAICGFRKFINADHIKKCYNDLVRNLEGACADLQFNVILSSYHTMREQDNNTEGYFAKIWEKLENVETMQHSELVLIKKLNKCLVSDNVEFNPIIKLAKIDPKDIDDVKSNCRKSTDLRGANNRIVKKILRKTVEVACKNILNYPRDDDTSESKKFQAKLAILNAIQCKYIIKFYGISNIGVHNTEIQQVLIQIINRAWEHSPYSRPSFAEITDELAELWKSFESIKYVAKFIAKDEVSSDEIQHYNIDEDSDFEVVGIRKKFFESPIPLDEGVKAHKEKDYEKAWKCFCENAELNNHNAIYWKAYYLETGKANETGKP